MEIERNSWRYKVAYTLNDIQPEQINLCSFFWKFVFMLFIGWPICLTIIAVIVAMVSVIGFFVAHRFPLFTDDCPDRNPTVPYRKWPTIKGYRILPIYFVLLAILLYILPTTSSPMSIVTSSTTWMVVGGIALVVAVVAGYRRLETAETYQLFKAYVAAKKAKVCPIIRVKGFDNN